MTPENKAFLAAQPAYDAALAAAESTGGPAATLNALLCPERVELREIALYPLTLGGYLLLQALDSPWLRGGEVTIKDNALVALALTNPEWIRGNVFFTSDLTTEVDHHKLAAKLTEAAHATPGWAWPGIVQHLLRQIQVMSGSSASPEDTDPLVLTPASLTTRPAATEAAAATPAGSP